MFTKLVFFWPPTPLRLYFLWYKSLQKLDFFDHLPPFSCKRSLWTAPYRYPKWLLWGMYDFFVLRFFVKSAIWAMEQCGMKSFPKLQFFFTGGNFHLFLLQKELKLDVCKQTKVIYRTRAIISRGLYTFLPYFQRPFMYCDLWPYVWLVFKGGF